jgi:KUP system potassium uptake protein
MVDWKVGRTALAEHIAAVSPPLTDFLAKLDSPEVVRIPGTAVFLSSNPDGTPPVLFMQARKIRALREKLVVLTVLTEHVPYVDEKERLTTEDLGKGVYRVVVRGGFMEKPEVPKLLKRAKLPIDLDDVTYFLGRETFIGGKGGKMGVFSEGLFAFLSRNARSATSWFAIPPEQVVEIGMQIDL